MQKSQDSTAPDQLPASFSAPVADHQVFAIKGPDTDRFLQGQVTCDIEELTAETSLPGAACNPKGRAYALFRLLRVAEDHVMMRLPASIADDVSSQLQKYLAFFKAEMTRADDWSLTGIVGAEAATSLSGVDPVPEAFNSVESTEQGFLVAVPPLPDGTPRFELWQPGDPVEADHASLTGEAWQLAEIRSGLTTLSPETTGAYIPLNLNLHAINGVSFQKGCYTGQEVIARMHHLGQLKKSLFHITASFVDSTPAVGDAIVDGEGTKLGDITDRIDTNSDRDSCEMLAVLSHKAMERTITLADQPAASLTLAPMGYRLPEQQDVVDNS